MISKISAAIAFSVVALFVATPTAVFAKSSNPTKTKQLQKQLKALGPNAPASQVLKIVKQLTKLDPAKAITYVKSALKTGALDIAEADKMNKQVALVVEKSDLPESKKESIIKTTTKTVINYDPPTPTPTPYQAMVTGSTVVLA